ncbi:fluoride efflux transporter CrcB [Nocardia crassostreae]|uniref:fluoride efflux transporter CrcB n=1 Tax=Nocardia crassostreae TaxID=53428 RepID=UPI001FE0974F|nr:fluoride efflux transporter CrcB [Nocardia crassostreae]
MSSEPVTQSIDPDIDLASPARRAEPTGNHGAILLAVALGSGLGALARYGMTRLLPTHPGEIPWATFLTNVTGCLLIGVLMVLITEVRTAHPLVRPFLGVGMLGGFTTFSTYAVEVHQLLQPGTAYLALAYLTGTLLAAMAATLTGTTVTRILFSRR